MRAIGLDLETVLAPARPCWQNENRTPAGHLLLRNDALDVAEISELKDLFWFHLLENGFWVTRRGFYALVLGTPQSELDRFVGVVEDFLTKYVIHARA